MEGLFLRMMGLSLTCSAVILPLLLLGRALRRRYAARSLYVLWLVLAVRLLLPVELSLPGAPVRVEVPRYTLSLPAAQVPPSLPSPEQVVVTVTTEVPVAAVLAVLWLAGVGAVLAYQLAVYLLARRALLRGAVPVETIPGARVVCSPLADTPMTLGVLRPVVVLPGGALEDLVLRHELCHLRRRDTAYKGLMLLCAAVHWFNPLVWLLAREAGRNLELCCDDEVTKGADGAGRRAYGEVLLRAASDNRGPALANQFGGPKGQMKERIMNLFTEKKRGAALVAAVVLLVAALGLLVAFRPAEVPVMEPTDPFGGTGAPMLLPVQTPGPEEETNDSAAHLALIPEKQMGVDFPVIDCVTEEFLVFHDYWGLAVYDFRQCQVVRLLDTPSLGLNLIQGDQFTEVRVIRGLDWVYLYNEPGEDEAYVYLLGSDIVRAVPQAQALEEPEAESLAKGTFLFPEGSEPVMGELVYQEPDGTRWKVFDTQEQWYWPLDGAFMLTNVFGARVHPITGRTGDHPGTDISAEQGTFVHAAQSGVVTASEFDTELGNYVEVRHENGVRTRYAHLERREVSVGDAVERGQIVGAVGQTGNATGPHLHLEFWKEGQNGGPDARTDALRYYPRLDKKFTYK